MVKLHLEMTRILSLTYMCNNNLPHGCMYLHLEMTTYVCNDDLPLGRAKIKSSNDENLSLKYAYVILICHLGQVLFDENLS
jgi:hypothetical protein